VQRTIAFRMNPAADPEKRIRQSQKVEAVTSNEMGMPEI